MKISKVWKAVAAGVGTVSTALTAAFADDLVDASDAATLTATLVEAAFTVYAVYKLRNTPA